MLSWRHGMIDELFSTRIHLGKVDNYEKIQQDFKDLIHVFDTEVGWEDLWDTHLITDNKFKDNIVKEYELTTFQEEIKKHVISYTGLENIRYDLHTSWMTRCDKGNYALCHEHGWSDISGVYYYQTNGKDGNIYFQTPVLAQTTCIWDARPNTIQYPPDQGGMILFPGWLRHGVNTNTTDHTRICISFNLSLIK